jgi:hypothetical protein
MFVRRRDGNVELREAENGLKSISGYAAVFYRADDVGTTYTLPNGASERIHPSAFDSYRQDDVRALFNHESTQLLGRQRSGTLTLTVDDHGLRYDIAPNDSQVYRDVVGWIERGDITGSSFGFRVNEDEWMTEDGHDIRTIKSVTLRDVGPVVFPAYTAATSEAASEESRSSYESYQAKKCELERALEKIREDRRRLSLDITRLISEK